MHANKMVTNYPSPLSPDDTIPPTPLWVKITRGIVASIIIAGLLYLSGVYQFLFLHRTPQAATQTVLPSKTYGQPIQVPVQVYLLTGPTGSFRAPDDITHLISNANAIWHQANLTFTVQDITNISASPTDLQLFQQDPTTFITASNTYQPNIINLYLTRTLSGVNGLAYRHTNTIAIADYTSSLDYRTLAHEFGHLLNLSHTSSSTRLMTSGTIGNNLSNPEIQTARSVALSFIDSDLQ